MVKIWDIELSEHKPIVVAEIGVNHNGSVEIAKRMVKRAKESGADAVKFQSFSPESLYSSEELGKMLPDGRTLGEFLTSVAFDYDEFLEIKKYADSIGIKFFSTPLSFEWVDFLDEMGVEVFKVASSDLTNLPFVRYVASKGKPVILSTGMAEMWEIAEAVKTITVEAGNKSLILMHCVSVYPPSPDIANLSFITTLKHSFGLPVGFSDHFPHIWFSVMALPLGVAVIEKHLKLEDVKGVDDAVSILPEQFEELKLAVDLWWRGEGRGVRELSDRENAVKKASVRRVFAKTGLKRGDSLTENIVDFLRGGNGITAMEFDKIYCERKLSRDVGKGEPLTEEHFI